MTPPLQQLLAASALIVTCEKLAASGYLPETEERNLRVLIARCCKAYQIPTIAERPEPANDSDFDSQLALVAQALNAPLATNLPTATRPIVRRSSQTQQLETEDSAT